MFLQRYHLVLGVSALSLAAACGALAQEGASSNPDDVQEVIVVGEKFGRKLKETAASVGYVSARDIENGTLIQGRDAYERMVNVSTINDGRFAIRGVPFDNVTGAGFGALGTIYVDNVRLSDKSTRFGPDLLWDVQSIEVLRGAQSTLQGRNALAGAIYIRSQDPTFDWQAKARVIASNGDGRDLAAAVSGPIVADKLAFRVSVQKNDMNGFVSNPVMNSDKVDFADDLQVRGKLLFTPNERLTIRLNVNYADIERRDALSDTRVLGADGYLAPGQTGAGFETGISGQASAYRRQSFVNVREYDKTKTTSGALIVDYDLSDTLTLTSETSAQRSENYKQRDNDGGTFEYHYASDTVALKNPYGIRGPSGSAAVDPVDYQHEDYDIFSQELRLKYDGGAWKWMAGVYYTKESEREDNFTLLVFRNLQPLVKGVAQSYSLDAATASFFASLYSNDAPLYTFNAQPVDVENYAVFGEGEYDLTDRLTFTVGLRYDHEKNHSGILNSGEVHGLLDPAVAAAINPALGQLAAGINAELNPFVTATQYADQTFHAWLPKFSVRYKAGEDLTFGFVTQRAYRAGGVSTNVVRQIVTPLKPEYTMNYELFGRAGLFGGRAHLDGNIYLVNWKDQQVAVDLSDKETDTIGANAGKSQLYGFEAQFDFRVNANLRLYSGLGYSHTEFQSFDLKTPEAAAALGITIDPDTFTNLVGKSFTNAPEWTAVLGGDWRNDAGYFGSLNIHYQGESYADTANTRKNDARTLVNLRLGRRFDKVTVAAFARNLFDEEYIRNASASRPVVGQPRVVGVSLETRF